jgi:hypothetical protein
MATLSVVVTGLANLESLLPAASALAKRHVGYGVKAADSRRRGTAVDIGAWSRRAMDAATHGSVDRGLHHSGQFHDF